MKSGKIFLISIISIILLSLIVSGFYLNIFSLPISITSTTSNSPIKYNANVCVYKNGELIDCSHNLLLSSGQNMTRTMLSTGGGGAVDNISLCNASSGSAGCAGTEGGTFTTVTACGLAPNNGTITDYGVEGNWTITRTFTATCSIDVNATRLTNDSDNFAVNTFTTTSLTNTDQITINWSVGVS